MFAVVMDGGLVQAVISDDPNCPIKEVMVIDYDKDDADDAELLDRASAISQSPRVDGTAAPEAIAFVTAFDVEDAAGVAATMRPVTERDLEELT